MPDKPPPVIDEITVYTKLGKLEEAVETLKKSTDKLSEKIDKLTQDITAGKVLLKTLMWIAPLGVGLLNIALAVVLHFWK